MNEITYLKIEARKLLDEVNRNDRLYLHESRLSHAIYEPQNIADLYSFKEKLRDIKQRINALPGRNSHIKILY
ncbi:MAG: hypothetical protein ABJA37_15750 [Ferruginibacter sp.]